MNEQEKIAIVMAHDYLSAIVRWGDDEVSDLGEILEIAFMAREAVVNLCEVFPAVICEEALHEVAS